MDIDELKIAPTDLSKLRNEVNNYVLKWTAYDELVKKFNAIYNIHASELVTKTDSYTKMKDTVVKIQLLFCFYHNYLVYGDNSFYIIISFSSIQLLNELS